MESARTLLGMLSDLHSMEAKFALALMESTLKLVSLADANIFILVQGDDNRRYYGGKKYLCDAFANGVLFPEATDVEMETNIEISSMTPKYAPQAGDGMPHHVRSFPSAASNGNDELFDREEAEEEPSLSHEDPISHSWAAERKRKKKIKPSTHAKIRRFDEPAIIKEEQTFEVNPFVMLYLRGILAV